MFEVTHLSEIQEANYATKNAFKQDRISAFFYCAWSYFPQHVRSTTDFMFGITKCVEFMYNVSRNLNPLIFTREDFVHELASTPFGDNEQINAKAEAILRKGYRDYISQMKSYLIDAVNSDRLRRNRVNLTDEAYNRLMAHMKAVGAGAASLVVGQTLQSAQVVKSGASVIAQTVGVGADAAGKMVEAGINAGLSVAGDLSTENYTNLLYVIYTNTKGTDTTSSAENFAIISISALVSSVPTVGTAWTVLNVAYNVLSTFNQLQEYDKARFKQKFCNEEIDKINSHLGRFIIADLNVPKDNAHFNLRSNRWLENLIEMTGCRDIFTDGASFATNPEDYFVADKMEAFKYHRKKIGYLFFHNGPASEAFGVAAREIRGLFRENPWKPYYWIRPNPL